MRSPFDRFLFFALMPLVIGAARAILLATPFVLFSGLAMWMLVPVALLDRGVRPVPRRDGGRADQPVVHAGAP
jgi:hypothetical protein